MSNDRSAEAESQRGRRKTRLTEQAQGALLDELQSGGQELSEGRSEAFSYLESVSPLASRIITKLVTKLTKNPDPHSCFWLTYLQKYGLLTESIRAELDEPPDLHEQSIREWMAALVVPSMERTLNANVFSYDPESERFETVEVFRLVSTVREIEPDLVREYESVLLEMPSRLARLADGRG